MSKWDKLIKRITNSSKDLRFDELRISKHEPIKKVYVEMVNEIVEREAKDCENDR